MAELMRRSEVLESTIQKEDENLYRIATDYWRIEECFWSLFHDDNRREIKKDSYAKLRQPIAS
jgi:hypothetical protein